MSEQTKSKAFKICPKTGKVIISNKKYTWIKWIFPFIGLVSLIWFLIRVIPKPSRATYPCQKVVFPLASGFVIWLTGILGSIVAFKKAKRLLAKAQYITALFFIAISIGFIWLAMNITHEETLLAEPIPNAPIGIAKGIHPGRVVWAHDPNATNWDGVLSEKRWWDDDCTDFNSVNKMLCDSIKALAGEKTETAAWDAIFKYYNTTKGFGNIGYQPGEKIAIKINLTTESAWQQKTDPVTYDKTSEMVYDLGVTYDERNRIDNSPQMTLALLRQLVYTVGVAQSDITIGDPTGMFANFIYNYLHAEFPDVVYMDNYGGPYTNPPSPYKRHRVEFDTNAPFNWSTSEASGKKQDYVPICFSQAKYFINFAILKGHEIGGVTLCAKNHYGSLIRSPYGAVRKSDFKPNNPINSHWPFYTPDDPPYYKHHKDLENNKGQGLYRPLVDLMAHPDLGDKTVLYLIDGLFAGYYAMSHPNKWQSQPFNGDWPSSLFVSQDPVAIDSVCYDFLYAEWPDVVTGGSGAPGSLLGTAEDYLIEAALANNPPSGMSYDFDPDHIAASIQSLGTHEHWNNEAEKKYSRNLGFGDGIELVTVPLRSQADINYDNKVNLADLAEMATQYLQRLTYYQQDSNNIVIEAENFYANTKGSGQASQNSWQNRYGCNSSNDQYVQVLPNIGININLQIETQSPCLSYYIYFNETGKYYLWLKAAGGNSENNSVHFGIDAVAISYHNDSAAQISGGVSFRWDSVCGNETRPTINLSTAGYHTVNIWMREDGAALDKIALTKSSSYNPSADEPQQTNHQPDEKTADLDSNGSIDLTDFAIFAKCWFEEVF
ncbi:MAG: DUF362 domain-containing protein [Planctomycetes bacterium]|nr:DUF362 domain-containing protein [Planctomycetota bacterium]